MCYYLNVHFQGQSVNVRLWSYSGGDRHCPQRKSRVCVGLTLRAAYHLPCYRSVGGVSHVVGILSGVAVTHTLATYVTNTILLESLIDETVYIYDNTMLISSWNEKCFRPNSQRIAKHIFYVQQLFSSKNLPFMR